MLGFVLRTAEKTRYCERCGLFTEEYRHVCKPSTAFEKLHPGTPEYGKWIKMFSVWDTGMWNTALIIQAARILDFDGAYVLLKDFFGAYHASVVGTNNYARVKPGGLLDLKCGNGLWLYINRDYSAAILDAELIRRIKEEAGG